MGTYDDERSGNYDNTYNRNFYKTKDRRNYNDENVSKKVDSIMEEMDKKVREKPFLEKIYFLMDVVHNNITYDHNLNDFTYKKDARMSIFKNYYDYKNSAKEVVKNKKGTCVGFSNLLKTLCEGSGIECKIMYYKNSTKNMNHQLNTVFDNGKKYYVDPTWGFVVDNLEELKAIYRGEKPNPRTNHRIGRWYKNQKSDQETGVGKEDQVIDNETEQKKSFSLLKIVVIIVLSPFIIFIIVKIIELIKHVIDVLQ